MIYLHLQPQIEDKGMGICLHHQLLIRVRISSASTTTGLRQSHASTDNVIGTMPYMPNGTIFIITLSPLHHISITSYSHPVAANLRIFHDGPYERED